MKRPFAVVGFSMFTVLLCLNFIERTDIAYCGLFLFIACYILSLFEKKLRKSLTLPTVLLFSALSCFLFISFSSDKVVAESLTGESVHVKAVICDEPYFKKSAGRYYVIAKLQTVEDEKVNGKIRLSFSLTDENLELDFFETGNTVDFNATVYVPGKDIASVSRYFAAEKILLGAYSLENLTFAKPNIKPVTYYFTKLRGYVSSCLLSAFGQETAGILTGLLTGDKEFLSVETDSALRKTGVSHLLAVSGLNLTVWVMFFTGAIYEGDRFYRLKQLLLFLSIIFIMLLAGMSDSVARAGFMSLTQLVGKMSRRKSDAVNLLGFSLFLMIIYNPSCVLSISLQLSFLSTLAILTLSKKLIENSSIFFAVNTKRPAVKAVFKPCLESLCISIGVLVYTAPVLIYNFGGISTVSALTNLLLVPITTPLMLCSGMHVIFNSVSFITLPLSLIIKPCTKYILFCINVLSKPKNSFIPFEGEFFLLYAASAFVLFGLIFVFVKKHPKNRLAILGLCLAVSVSVIIFHESIFSNRLSVILTDCNDTCAVIIHNSKEAVIIGEKSNYENRILEGILESKNLTLKGYLKEIDSHLALISSSDGKTVSEGSSFDILDEISISHNSEIINIQLKNKTLALTKDNVSPYSVKADALIENISASFESIVIISDDKTLFPGKDEVCIFTDETNRLIISGVK